ncbi:MAG: 3-isopropylmalate dehydratase small subunit [Acidobacteriota bacterium]
MAKFTTLESAVVPLPIDNVDTDQIIPARYLKVTDRSTIAEGLSANWRYRGDDENLETDPDFVLNQPRYEGAQVLLAGDNFGCGSSREHAPWALYGNGFRAVLSTRFADIFRSNSLKNGLLPVEIDAETSSVLFAQLRLTEETGAPPPRVVIDLEEQTLVVPSEDGTSTLGFSVDPFAKACLLEGVDQMGYLVDRLEAIRGWEAERAPRVETAATQAAQES